MRTEEEKKAAKREYDRLRRSLHPEKLYHFRYPDRARAASRKYRGSCRIRILQMYGSKCCNCGEGDETVLQLDHVNNDGAEHKRVLGSRSSYVIFREAGKEYQPSKYQLLCANCHVRKHKKEKKELEQVKAT